MSENDDYLKWLYRDLDDSFYERSGRVGDQDELMEMFDDIHDDFKFEAYCLVEHIASLVESDLDMDCLDIQLFLYVFIEKFQRKEDVKLKIPYYWSDRPVIPPEVIARITNGILGFEPDESCDDCIRTDECWYYNNREIRNDGD